MNLIHMHGLGDIIYYIQGINYLQIKIDNIYVYQKHVYEYLNGRYKNTKVHKVKNRIHAYFLLIRYQIYISHRISGFYSKIISYIKSGSKRYLKYRKYIRKLRSDIPRGHLSLLSLYQGIDYLVTNNKPIIIRENKEVDSGAIKLEKVILVPGSGKGQSFKRWPINYYQDLIKELRKKSNISIYVVLGEDEKDLYEICYEISKKIKNIKIIKDTSLREIEELINESTVIVSGDSGLAHLGAIKNAYLITLFGPSDYKKTKPLSRKLHPIFTDEIIKCAPCITKNYAKGCDNPICMKTIDVKKVLLTFEKINNE